MARKQGSKTEEIAADWWDAGETVTIRSHVTHGIQKQLQAAMAACVEITSTNFDATGSPDMKVDLKKAMVAGEELQMQLMIVSWTLKDKNGTVIPLTPEGIDSLVEEDTEYIISKISARDTPPLTEKEQESFLPTQAAGIGG